MFRFLFLFYLFLFLSTSSGFAQRTMLEHIRQEDGLPSDMVKSLVMDSDGFIWAGTDDGVAKIEGANFVTVVEREHFFDMYKAIILSKKFGLVAATDSGLINIKQVYTGIQSKYLKNSFNLSNLPHFRFPKNVFESTDSSLWISYPDQVVRIKSQAVSVLNFPQKNHTYNFFRSYQVIEPDSNHLFILSQKGFLYSLNKGNDEINEVPWNYAGTEIFTVCKINNQQFLIGCNAGLLQMNFENGKLKDVINLGFSFPVSVILQKDKNHFVLGTWLEGAYEYSIEEGNPTYSLLEGTSKLRIYDILADKQNQVWLATDFGIFIYRKLVFDLPFKNLSKSNIKNIVPAPDGIMYFTEGEIVYRVDNEGHLSKYYKSKHGEITSLAICKESLLIGTIKGYIIYKKFNGTTSMFNFSNAGKEIYSIAIDKNLNILFLQPRASGPTVLMINKNGDVFNLTPKINPGADFNFNALKISPMGDVYIAAGGVNQYLYKYNNEKGTVDNLSVPIKTLDGGLLWNFDLKFINNQTLLLASHKGIYKYQNNTMIQYNLGFQTNKVTVAVASDNKERVWLAAHNGIICYENGTTMLYNEADGIPNKLVNGGCLYIDSNNNLWAGTAEGMIYSKIPDEIKPSTQPIISSIKKSGLPIEIVNENRFLQNSLLNFTFASADYPSKYILYQYSLNKDNAKDEWIDMDKRKDYLFFDNLKKGDYTLKVRAKNKGHYTWSKPTHYRFSIYKIWYTRPEIIVAINLLILFLAYIYLHFNRIKSIKRRHQLEEIISLRTSELVAQNQELLKTQKQLIQSEKMASIGLLAAGIAHEINNPVNYVSAGISVLKKSHKKLRDYLNAYRVLFKNANIKRSEYLQIPDENQIELSLESTDDMFKTIEEGIGKTIDIVQSIRVFSSNSENTFVEIDIHEIIDSILLILYNQYKNRIEIVKEYALQSKIIGVSVNIQQIIMNLIINAIQAIPEKGTIRIKTQMDSKNKNFIISVKDDGIGIPIEIQDKLFDPFFSTKEVGKGTGLGLYLTYSFVEQHHGSIKIVSEPGKGAEFIVELPAQSTKNLPN
ncbi:MAG: ATP-binding protein [Bacteroidales bacterium]|nr:ATP-binding protein [Bacteroidales bacterium]